MQYHQKKAFTLVELIVVITILAILGTIAFISLQGYSKQARDTRRVSDISNIKKSLELFSLNTGKYPIPDEAGTVAYSGETLFTQGIIGDNVTQNLSSNLQEKPLDPLHEIEYIYSTTNSRREYELLAFYEGEVSKAGKQAHAANIYKNKISGNYNGVFVRSSNFIVPLPSIITSETLSYDLYDDTSKIKSQIISNGNNYPDIGIAGIEKTTGGLNINFAYTGVINDNSTDAEKISVLDTIQLAYNGSDLATIGIYANILGKITDKEKLTMVEDMVLKNNTSGLSSSSESSGPTGNDDFTKLLIHSNNDNFTTTFTDSSSINNSIIVNGDVQHLEGGIVWNKPNTNLMIDLGESGSWDNNHILPGNVIKDNDGTYKMWFSGNDGSNWAGGGYATSSDGISWTKYNNNPVIGLGDAGKWDSTGIIIRTIIKENDNLYKMWYTGKDDTNNWRVGYATSLDGISWTKYALNPVLNLGDSWDSYNVYTPEVIKESDGNYKMWYSGFDGINWKIGYATSSDGISWTKYIGNPIVDLGDSGSWEEAHVLGINVIKTEDGKYKGLYSGNNLSVRQVGYIGSDDGITWQKYNKNPLLDFGDALSWDPDGISYPEWIKDSDGTYKMWYGGRKGTNWRILYAESKGAKFGKSSINFDGTGDYLSLPDSEDWDFGGDNFTIDFWMNAVNLEHDDGIIAGGSSTVNGYAVAVHLGDKLVMYSDDGMLGIKTDTVVTTGNWSHYAIVRDGDFAQWYINGVPSGEKLDVSSKTFNSNGGIKIGRYLTETDNYYFNGQLDELRISKGIARTTDSSDYMYDPEGDGFTPPTQVYGN